MSDEDGWEADWQAARARDYGETGVAMILALEVEGAPEPGLADAVRAAASSLQTLGATSPAAVLETVALREMRRAEADGP